MKRSSRSRKAAAAVAFGVAALVAGSGVASAGAGVARGPVEASGRHATVGSWILMPPLHSPRDFAATVRLADGRVLVSGGRTGVESTETAEVFDPATRTWTLTGSMPVATRTHSMVLLRNGQVLAAGGEDAGTVASLYNPRTGVWTQTAPMPKPRMSMASIRLPNGEAMFVGGYTPNFEFTNDVQIFNPTTGRWRLGAPLPTDWLTG